MHYLDYVWKDGIPLGIKKIEENKISPRSYKIITGPYKKRISIERYYEGIFDSLVYDSILFDFRSIKTLDDALWERVLISSTALEEKYLLKDAEDRLVAVEAFSLLDKNPKICRLYSIHGFLIGSQAVYSKEWGEKGNGVILFDSLQKQVMWKSYAMDPTTFLFTDLLKEIWDDQTLPDFLENNFS